MITSILGVMEALGLVMDIQNLKNHNSNQAIREMVNLKSMSSLNKILLDRSLVI